MSPSQALTMRWLVITCALIAAVACGGPKVSTIKVRYVGKAGLPAVDVEAVQVVRGPEVHPHRVIADLEVPTDGSTYESLVERLRRRAGDLGCDSICELRSVFDVGSSQMAQTPGPPNPNFEQSVRDATALGVSMLLKAPRWVSVRATGVLLTTPESGDQGVSWRSTGETSSAAQEIQNPERAMTLPPAPPESKPVDKP